MTRCARFLLAIALLRWLLPMFAAAGELEPLEHARILELAVLLFTAADVNRDQHLDSAERLQAVKAAGQVVQEEVRRRLGDPEIQWLPFMGSRSIPVLASNADGLVDRQLFDHYLLDLFQAAEAAIQQELIWRSQWENYEQYRALRAEITVAEQVAIEARRAHEQSEDKARHERHQRRRHFYDPAAQRRADEAQAEMEKLHVRRQQAERKVRELKQAISRQPGNADRDSLAGHTGPIVPPTSDHVILAHRQPASRAAIPREASELERQAQRQLTRSAEDTNARLNHEHVGPAPGRPAVPTAESPRNLFDESRRELPAADTTAHDHKQQPADQRNRQDVDRRYDRPEYRGELIQRYTRDDAGSRTGDSSRPAPRTDFLKSLGMSHAADHEFHHDEK